MLTIDDVMGKDLQEIVWETDANEEGAEIERTFPFEIDLTIVPEITKDHSLFGVHGVVETCGECVGDCLCQWSCICGWSPNVKQNTTKKRQKEFRRHLMQCLKLFNCKKRPVSDSNTVKKFYFLFFYLSHSPKKISPSKVFKVPKTDGETEYVKFIMESVPPEEKYAEVGCSCSTGTCKSKYLISYCLFLFSFNTCGAINFEKWISLSLAMVLKFVDASCCVWGF